jgi:hypothetical protein
MLSSLHCSVLAEPVNEMASHHLVAYIWRHFGVIAVFGRLVGRTLARNPRRQYLNVNTRHVSGINSLTIHVPVAVAGAQ